MEILSLRPFLTAPAIAAVVSSLLTFAPNGFVASTGLVGSAGFAGYSFAGGKVSQQRRRQEKGFGRDVTVRNLKQQLADTQANIRKAELRATNTAKELEAASAAREGLLSKNKELAAQVAQLSKASPIAPVLDLCAYTEQMNKLKATIADNERAIADLELLLNHDLQDADFSALRNKVVSLLRNENTSDLEDQVNELQGDKDKLTAAYRSLNTALEKAGLQYDSELSELEGIKNSQDEQALQTIAHWKQQAAQLAARIKELETEASKPGRFGGLGAADVMGNRLIDFLADNGVLMSAVETDPNPDKGLLVTLKPASHTSSIEIKNLMPRCESSLGLHTLPTVLLDNGNYHFRLAVDPLKNTAETVTLKSNLKKLEKAIDAANHLFIFGSSGSGKSVFLDNAIWLGKCLWPDAKLDLCDPKAPFTEWSSLVPTHKGGEATVDAVIDMAKKMKVRLADARKQHDQTGNIPEYPRHIFAIDEATVAYDDAKLLDMDERKGEKLAVNFGVSVASVLRLGRALGFKGYLLSQTMLVSKLGLNNGDYGNATCIFLNGMIDRALKGELKDLFEADDLTAIDKELERRRTQGQSYIGLLADSNTGDLFLFEAPRPGFYADRFEAENANPLNRENSPIHHVTEKEAKTCEPLQANGAKGVREMATVEAITNAHPPITATIAVPRAKCPKCSEASTKLNSKKPQSNGKYRFICQNADCETQTFRALPE